MISLNFYPKKCLKLLRKAIMAQNLISNLDQKCLFEQFESGPKSPFDIAVLVHIMCQKAILNHFQIVRKDTFDPDSK